RPALTVVAGLLKAGKLDLVVAKLTEVGVARLPPAACGRSVARLDARTGEAARERWTTIARAAAKQSHRALVPEVLPVAPLTEQVARAERPVLVCWEESRSRLAEALPAPPAAGAPPAGGAGGRR